MPKLGRYWVEEDGKDLLLETMASKYSGGDRVENWVNIVGIYYPKYLNI